MKSHKRIWWLYWCFQIFLILFLALKVSAQHSFVIRTMLNSVLPATTFSYSVDCASPVGTDAPSTLDDKDRETRYGFAERLNVDHYFALTGTSLSDAAIGQHRHVEFYAPISTPTYAANKGWLYTKDVSSAAELHWLDESNNEIQFTTGGKINAADLGSFPNNTYVTAVDVAGTGTVNLIKADANDMPVLPNDTQTATNAAPSYTKSLVNKKYVDDQDTADHPAYTGGESHTDGSGMIIKQGTVNVSANSSATKTFAVAFPTECTRVIISPTFDSIEGALGGLVWVRSKAKTAITVFNSIDVTVAVDWIAIGY